ncbi:hypothetical protein KK083_24370 [Fulvivirgaceae bacterium PWU4]|uniref:DUF6089 domain-containing protein n=1 Tax=Chryseosolibacter histidini TaxID=2782349 RepID=A0AAP2GRI9_9BACT|nr:DUF6089 family protein [Chryseosolibacter histidini]MBT1700045.1 hypothetical protein [Chryseosolibacter histidini]
MRKFFYLSIVVCLLFSAHESMGQMNRKAIKKNNRRISSFKGRKFHFGKEKRYNALGVSLSALNYYGDLAPKPSKVSTDISFTRPAITISLGHRFGPRYTLTTAFMFGTLSGSDAESADKGDASNGMYRYNRNLSFRNRIKELSVTASLDLFENQATYISRVVWTPYIYGGLAVIHHNPQALAPETGVDGQPLAGGGKWVDLQPLGTEGQHATLQSTDANAGIKPYKLIQPAIPFGFGARFRINEVMDFSAELGFRYLFTDYIDDVSRSYVDLGVFGNDELAKAMSYRTGELAEFNPSAVNTSLEPYTGRDQKQYYTLAGYGREWKGDDGSSNVRGNNKDKDIYMVTTFRLTYILGKTFHRAKFR